MADLSNNLNPLDWRVPIVNPNGTPTPEFQRKWAEQMRTNGSIPDLTSAAAVSQVLDLFSTARGSLLARGASAWGALPIGAANTLLQSTGSDPAWSSLSSVLDTIGNTRGSLLFRGAAGWNILAPGTSGNVLTSAGAGADPTYQPAAGGGAAVSSVNDDGTNFYIALMDANGQLVLDGSGDPVFIPEVLPVAAIPTGLPYSTALAFQVKLTSDQTLSSGANSQCKPDTFVTNSMGAQYSPTTGKFTPTKAGLYAIFATGQSVATSPDTITQNIVSLLKNGGFGVGTQICTGQSPPNTAAARFSYVALTFGVVSMNGSTDWIEMSVRADSTGAGLLVESGAGNVTFGAYYLGQ